MVAKMPTPLDNQHGEQPENTRDTIPDTDLTFDLESDIIGNEVAATQSRTNALLQKRAEWYSREGIVKIIDIDRDRNITAKRLELARQLGHEFLKPAYSHIKAKTPQYVSQYARQYQECAIFFLHQALAKQDLPYLPIDLVLELQNTISNGNWLTKVGLYKMYKAINSQLNPAAS